MLRRDEKATRDSRRNRRSSPTPQNGCSNSRFHDSFCRVAATGVDTVSYAFRPKDAAALDRVRGLWSRREALNRTTGELIRLDDGPRGSIIASTPIGAMRLGAFPGHGLLYAEGRLGAILAESAEDHTLAPAKSLSPGAELARRAFGDLGLEISNETAAVRRLDLAGELHFDRPDDGLCFLRALANLDVPGSKRDIWMQDARVETIYYRTPKRGQVRLRCYDKGVESGSHEPGARIRLERQVRYAKAQQQTPEAIRSGDLEKLYQGRLAAWTDATTDVVATDLNGAQQAVLERLAADQVTPRVAERLLGTLVLVEHFGFEWWEKRHTAQRRKRELRELGIVLDLERQVAEPVPIGKLLTELRSAFATG